MAPASRRRFFYPQYSARTPARRRRHDSELAVAARACAGALARHPAEEVPYAVEDARLRLRGPIVDRGWRRRRNVHRDCLRRRGVHMPAKFDGRAQPHFAHEQNGFGSRIGRRFGRIGVKTEWRHENGIDRLPRRSGWRRGIVGSRVLRRQRGGQSSHIKDRLGTRRRYGLGRFHVGAREIARTGGGIRLKRLNLAAGEAHRAALRNRSCSGRKIEVPRASRRAR